MKNFLTGVAVTAALIAALGVTFAIGRGSGDGGGRLVVADSPTSSPVPPTPVPTPPPSPPPEPAVLPDRTNCNEIRGTDYRSPTERLWFLDNCKPPPLVIRTPQATASACSGLGRMTLEQVVLAGGRRLGQPTDYISYSVPRENVWVLPGSYVWKLVSGITTCFEGPVPIAVCADGFITYINQTIEEHTAASRLLGLPFARIVAVECLQHGGMGRFLAW